MPCLYRWHKKKKKKKLCCILQTAHQKRDVRAAQKFNQRPRSSCQLQTRSQQCDPTSPASFNLQETLYPHAKTSHEKDSPLAECGNITRARCEANLHLTECGSATLDEFFSSCPSLMKRARDMIHTFNNYCKCNYHLQNRLLLFIQT